MLESPIEIFGIVAISTMVISYALEKTHVNFVAIFSLACCCAAVYAYLIGSYPFMAAEGIWAVVAGKRWLNARR